MHAINHIYIAIILLLITGCSTNAYRQQNVSNQDRQKVVDLATDMLGVSYRYGGQSPKKGFDCSGLVYYTHKQAGIRIPRTTREQFRAVRQISYRSLLAGDLIFFSTNGNGLVSHVGIYVGGGKFIHAPSSGKRVSVANINDRYWKHHYSGAGRL
jgi:cell wall-associated NlpC family hydrolase